MREFLQEGFDFDRIARVWREIEGTPYKASKNRDCSEYALGRQTFTRGGLRITTATIFKYRNRIVSQRARAIRLFFSARHIRSVTEFDRLTFWAMADFLKDLSAKPTQQNVRSETKAQVTGWPLLADSEHLLDDCQAQDLLGFHSADAGCCSVNAQILWTTSDSVNCQKHQKFTERRVFCIINDSYDRYWTSVQILLKFA